MNGWAGRPHGDGCRQVINNITDKPQGNVGLNCRYGSIFWYPTFSCVRKFIFSHKKMLGKAKSPL